LLNFDKDNIPEKRMQALLKIINKPEFDVEKIRAKVASAADIALFCKAMATVRYLL